jgi:hypothetical protein
MKYITEVNDRNPACVIKKAIYNRANGCTNAESMLPFNDLIWKYFFLKGYFT